jgi:hypothetical protein
VSTVEVHTSPGDTVADSQLSQALFQCVTKGIREIAVEDEFRDHLFVSLVPQSVGLFQKGLSRRDDGAKQPPCRFGRVNGVPGPGGSAYWHSHEKLEELAGGGEGRERDTLLE